MVIFCVRNCLEYIQENAVSHVSILQVRAASDELNEALRDAIASFRNRMRNGDENSGQVCTMCRNILNEDNVQHHNFHDSDKR